MKSFIGRRLHLEPESEEDMALVEKLKAKFEFDNPVWKRAHEQGLSTRGIPRYLTYWDGDDTGVSLPRACVPNGERATELFGRAETLFADKVVPLTAAFRECPDIWHPREGQQEAVDAMIGSLEHWPWGGTLNAPCGSGKTVMGLEIARRLGVPTLVLVHKEFLMKQWKERAEEFLPGASVGFWRGDRSDSGRDYDIVIAMIQSLVGVREYDQDLYYSFGLVISDEVHRLGAPNWYAAIGQFHAKHRLGLTATPNRKDGLATVFLSSIGPVAHSVVVQRETPELVIRKLETAVSNKSFVQAWNRKPNISKLVTILSKDASRTGMILADVVRATDAGRKILVLTARLDHVNQMVRALCMRNVDASRFVGGMGEDEQAEALESDVVVGTYPMAQEGLDVPEFDTLFLATPQTSVEQAVGRIMRECDGKKKPLVVDYVDSKISICSGMFRTRSRVYSKLGVVAQGS